MSRNSYWKFLTYLGILAFGINFVNTLLLINMSSIYKFLGAASSSLPYLGLGAPIAGLIVQPIVGHLSDNTISKYGKRRPYILFWSLLACITCMFVYFMNTLWAAVLLMWVLMSSINGAVEGVRALIGDAVPNPQKTSAFSTQTILSGVAAGVASVFPAFLSKTTHSFFAMENGPVPIYLRISFIIGGFIWLASLIWTILLVEEKAARQPFFASKKSKTLWQKTIIFYKDFLKTIRHLPPIIKELGIIQFFTQIGVYAVWMYFSLALSQHLYGLPPNTVITHNSPYTKLLEKGTLEANALTGIQQIISVGFALFIPLLTKKIPPKKLFGISLLVGAIGFISVRFFNDVNLLRVCMIAVGIAWGAIAVLPYVIIASSVRRSRMGVYLGIFNISVTLPQIFAGFILDPVYSYFFHYHAMNVITMSGLLILLSGIATLYLFSEKR